MKRYVYVWIAAFIAGFVMNAEAAHQSSAADVILVAN